ncbi:MAG: tryptophan synthase subunit alpha, partial [Deltaproteobacteria bacterium]|nr:tryptophan synthase subunit alpha [Deltaproteobacteria bacterium]
PDKSSFWEALKELAENGADIIEIGIPFSDPVADGPVVAAASQKALENGVDIDYILSGLKTADISVPIVLMSYANPLIQHAWKEAAGDDPQTVLANSLELLAATLKTAKVAGVIVPDVPLEESGPFLKAFQEADIDLVPLVGPNTTSERMARYAPVAKGYVYVVSVLGTTGVRDALAAQVDATLKRAKNAFTLPLALGFGLKDPSQLAALEVKPDAVIFGSALLNHLSNGARAKDFIKPWIG